MKGHDFPARNTAILAGEQAAASIMADLKRKLAEKRGQ
jgi:NTE family protein